MVHTFKRQTGPFTRLQVRVGEFGSIAWCPVVQFEVPFFKPAANQANRIAWQIIEGGLEKKGKERRIREDDPHFLTRARFHLRTMHLFRRLRKLDYTVVHRVLHNLLLMPTLEIHHSKINSSSDVNKT